MAKVFHIFEQKFFPTLLCEWLIESLGKCFFLYPHLNIRSYKRAYIAGICFRTYSSLHIKSNKSAYIAGICFRMQSALHIKSNKSAYIAGICFRMQSAFQQMVKHQTIHFVFKCGQKTKQSICLQRDYRGTIIINSVL